MKRILTLVMMLCMLLSFTAVSGAAVGSETTDEYMTQHWNIMLVLDGSKSMDTTTDPDDLRYAAIDSFIDTLWNQGDYVGAIVFTASLEDNTSDDSMRRGIKLDTWARGTVALQDNKNNLKKQIRSAEKMYSDINHADTDIGTALLVAEERLNKACNENGLPGIIFLITDGEISMNHSKTLAQSEANLQTAVEKIKENGHILFGTYINSTTEQSQELRDAVKQADGLLTGDLVLGKYYFEIKSANELFNIFDKFLEVIGFSMPGNEIIRETCDKTFNIPGTGAEELNIRFRTEDGQKLPDITVTITRPNGKKLTGDELNAIYSSEDTYRMYKVHDPEAGTWMVHFEIPRNNTTPIVFDRIFNTYIEAAMSVSPKAASLHSNMTVNVEGFLSKKGTLITDPELYAGYTCQLILTDMSDGTEYRYDITPDSNGHYILNYHLDIYGEFEAKVEFVCNEFFAESETEVWNLTNHVPECKDIPEVSLECGLLQNAEYSVDLTPYIDDAEDGDDLLVSISSTTCNEEGIRIDGTTVILNPFLVGSGEINLKVRDSQSAFGNITIPVTVKMHKADSVDLAGTYTIADNYLNSSEQSYNIMDLLSLDPNEAGRLNIGVREITCDESAVKLDGATLSIDKTRVGNGTIVMALSDDVGVSDELTINVDYQDRTLLYATAIAAAIIVVIIIILICIRERNSRYPRGTCTLTFDVADENDRETTLNVNLTPPGQGSRRKTDLYTLLREDMNRQAGALHAVCDEEDIEYDIVERFINDLSKDLRKVSVSCVVGKQKGLGKIGKVRVVSGKRKDTLFNSSVNLLPGGHAMTFAYYLQDNNNMAEDYYSTDDNAGSRPNMDDDF